MDVSRITEVYWRLRIPITFVQAMCGMLVFTHGLPMRGKFFCRFPACLAAGFAAVCGINWLLNGVFGLPYRLVLLLVCGLVMLSARVCWDISWDMALFMGADGYLAQHAAGSLKTLLRLLFSAFGLPALAEIASVLSEDLLCYGLTYLLLFLLLRRSAGQLRLLDRRTRLVFTAVILILCFGMSQLAKSIEGRPNALASDELYIIGCTCLILGMECLMVRSIRLAQDVAALKVILRQQRLQYENSRGSIQLINEKYHDLKQMLQTFRGHLPEREMDKLSRQVSAYDAQIHTGSAVLDVLLTEKHLQCDAQGIRLTCMADGSGLHFMDELDLYVLVGNALTNAVEAVQALPPAEERFINLHIETMPGGCVTVHMENPFAGELLFMDGLPQSRRDPQYHGFGMKSMLKIVEKYQGALSVQEKGGRFLLDILLLDSTA